VRDGDAEVYTLDLDRGIVYNVTHSPAWERDFVWSPDGGRLAFYSNRSGGWEVYTIYASGGGSQRLTENRLFETSLVWFKDSEEIAFVVPGAEGNSLVTLNIDNRHYDERALSQILGPSWSPDGKLVAFFGYSRGTIGLFVMDAMATGG
jgi:Tol biopolymer transport system component